MSPRERRAALRAMLDARRLGLDTLEAVAPELMAQALPRELSVGGIEALTGRRRYRQRMARRLTRLVRLAPLTPRSLTPAARLCLQHTDMIASHLAVRCGIALMAGPVLSRLDQGEQALMNERLELDARATALVDRDDAEALDLARDESGEGSIDRLVLDVRQAGRQCVGVWLHRAPPAVAQRIALLAPDLLSAIHDGDSALAELTERIAARLLQETPD